MSGEAAIDPQRNLRRMHEYGPLYAQAKANRLHIEEYRKSLKAQLMKASGESAIAAQERDAYAHPDYIAFLAGYKAAVEEEDTLRWRLLTAQAAIEVYRTLEASNRNMDRSAA